VSETLAKTTMKLVCYIFHHIRLLHNT